MKKIMQYKIIVDSACNLTENDFTEKDIGFSLAPLSIHVGSKEYLDCSSASVSAFLEERKTTKEKIKTSCPSPSDFLKEREGATYYILITLASRLSGAYNAARLAKEGYEHSENVLVVDSGLAAGAEELLVLEAVRLIKENLSFAEISKKREEKKNDIEFVFGLSSLDSLANSGRFPKPLALIFRKLHRKLIGTAKDGKISVKERKHSRDGLRKARMNQITKSGKDRKDKTRVINYTGNKNDAFTLKDRVRKCFTSLKQIIVRENRLLCSFYASQDGLLLSF